MGAMERSENSLTQNHFKIMNNPPGDSEGIHRYVVNILHLEGPICLKVLPLIVVYVGAN